MRLALFALLALPTDVAAQAPVAEGLTVAYACAGGDRLRVAYINPKDGTSYAVVAHGGALVPMKAGPTGSGVRYLSLDGTGLVWHAKGDHGFLARDDAEQATIAADCTATSG